LRSGKVIKLSHSPIITEEACEPSRRDVGGSEAAIVPTTTDIEEVVTSIIANLRRTVTSVTTTSGKADTLVIADSTIFM